MIFIIPYNKALRDLVISIYFNQFSCVSSSNTACHCLYCILANKPAHVHVKKDSPLQFSLSCLLSFSLYFQIYLFISLPGERHNPITSFLHTHSLSARPPLLLYSPSPSLSFLSCRCPCSPSH